MKLVASERGADHFYSRVALALVLYAVLGRVADILIALGESGLVN